MAAPVVATIHAGTTVVLLARVLGKAGAVVTQASLSAIRYDIWKVDLTYRQIADLFGVAPERDAPKTPRWQPIKQSGPTSLVIADTIYDALQTSGGWTVDDEGYNFRAELPETSFVKAPLSEYPNPRYYQIDVEFTATAGGVFSAQFFTRATHFLVGHS